MVEKPRAGDRGRDEREKTWWGKRERRVEEGTRGRKRVWESESRVRGRDEREKAWWGKREQG